MKCSNCGKEVEGLNGYCPDCGAQLPGEKLSPKRSFPILGTVLLCCCGFPSLILGGCVATMTDQSNPNWLGYVFGSIGFFAFTVGYLILETKMMNRKGP